ncbi:hypothetical protein EUX57_19180, partial [Pseudomonas orientalis]
MDSLQRTIELQCGRGLAPDGHTHLHTCVAPKRNHDAKRVALDLAFDLDLRRPVKPRWPNAG